MKYLGFFLISLMVIASCDTSTRMIFDPSVKDELPIPASAIFVKYSSGQTLKAPATISFETRLDKKYPCYLFSHFETTVEDGEIFIKPYVLYGNQPCTPSSSNIVRNYTHLFEEPGKYLIHFYMSDDDFFNLEIEVGE